MQNDLMPNPAHLHGEPAAPMALDSPQARQNDEPSAAARIASLLAEIRDLRAQLDTVREERNRFAESRRQIMELLGAPLPEKLVHELRNVLNERDLLKALVDQMDSTS